MKSSKSNNKISVTTKYFFEASMSRGTSQCHLLIDSGHWKRCQILCLHKLFYIRHLRDGYFQKWADKGLYSCILVVWILRVKIGPFCGWNVALSQLMFWVVLLATLWLFLVCSRLRRGQLGASKIFESSVDSRYNDVALFRSLDTSRIMTDVTRILNSIEHGDG